MLKIRTSIPKVDVPVLSGIERCKYYHAVHCKKDNDDLTVTDIFSIDVKGYLPTVWINDPMAEESIDRLKKTYNILKNIAFERKK